MTGAGPWLQGFAPRKRLWLVAGCGAVAALGLPPFNLPLLALIGFAGGIVVVQTAATVRQALWLGLVMGTGFFAVALHWIVEPFFVDPWRHGWMAPFALVFMSAGLALFWAAAAGASVRASRAGAGRLVVFALFLALAEYLRGVILTGFPWAQPGHIWIGSPLMPLAAWIGPEGLTLLTLLLAAGLATALLRPVWVIVPAGALSLALGLSLMIPPAPPAAAGAPVVRLIQPYAPQHLKWRPDMIGVFFNRALDLTEQAPQLDRAPDLVIWPEASLPALLRNSADWRAAIGAASGDARVIVGGQRIDGGTDGGTDGDMVRNSLFYLDPEGELLATYDKHHLVPFGEYIPLTSVARALGLRGLAEAAGAGYSPGAGPRVIDLGALGRVFPMICYETIFPDYIRDVPRPDWQVQITNDAWFGQFSGPFQHLELARLRAAEQGLPLLRAANTGVSAVIDARGQVLASLPMGQAGALDTALPPSLPPTLYARSGDAPVIVALIALLAGLLWRERQLAH